jgi:D-hexose-6-phosphate mutarotase
MDSNSRSTTWHDVLTNSRGKLLDEFFVSNQLHVIKEDGPRTTFQSSKGSSNIDLTIVNKQMLAKIKDWEISEEESCSEHNIIKFNLNTANDKAQLHDVQGIRYIIKEHQHIEFQSKLLQSISKNFQIENDERNIEDMDKKLNSLLLTQHDIDTFLEKFDKTIQETCKKTLKHKKSLTKAAKGKSVPWRTDTLKILRKKANALRRRYQRTLNNEELREYRKNQHIEGKKK